jgi:signal transduction histidine kinase
LYNLIDFLDIQTNHPELLDENSQKRIQTKTTNAAKNLLTSMEDMLLWSKGQMENFMPQPQKISISSLFDDTSKHFSSEEKVLINFENPDNLEFFTDENYLKTIVRNLTGNAINASDLSNYEKAKQNPTIIWKAWRMHEKSFLSITDNGPGGTQENFKALYDDSEVVGIKTGLGLHLIRDLAAAINCEIAINSTIGVGTTFTLSLN